MKGCFILHLRTLCCLYLIFAVPVLAGVLGQGKRYASLTVSNVEYRIYSANTHNTSASWYEANEYCLSTNGTLASIKSEEIHGQIASAIDGNIADFNNTTGIWIGLIQDRPKPQSSSYYWVEELKNDTRQYCTRPRSDLFCDIGLQSQAQCERNFCCWTYRNGGSCLFPKGRHIGIDSGDGCSVDKSVRDDCGFHGITPASCNNTDGCCWSPTDHGLPWCTYTRTTPGPQGYSKWHGEQNKGNVHTFPNIRKCGLLWKDFSWEWDHQKCRDDRENRGFVCQYDPVPVMMPTTAMSTSMSSTVEKLDTAITSRWTSISYTIAQTLMPLFNQSTMPSEILTSLTSVELTESSPNTDSPLRSSTANTKGIIESSSVSSVPPLSFTSVTSTENTTPSPQTDSSSIQRSSTAATEGLIVSSSTSSLPTISAANIHNSSTTIKSILSSELSTTNSDTINETRSDIRNKNSLTVVYIGVGIGTGVIMLLLIIIVVVVFSRRRRKKPPYRYVDDTDARFENPVYSSSAAHDKQTENERNSYRKAKTHPDLLRSNYYQLEDSITGIANPMAADDISTKLNDDDPWRISVVEGWHAQSKI